MAMAVVENVGSFITGCRVICLSISLTSVTMTTVRMIVMQNGSLVRALKVLAKKVLRTTRVGAVKPTMLAV